jgi:hypothetical protein
MPYPSPETVSQEEFIGILARLRLLLRNLPSQLPRQDGFNSKYGSFLNFGLDQEILEKTGDEIATLGEQLERIFGWQAHTMGDGIIPIIERGNAICALVPILDKYSKKYPDNNVLKKWGIDIALGAEKVFELHQVPVRWFRWIQLSEKLLNLSRGPQRQLCKHQCPPIGIGSVRNMVFFVF